MIHVTVPDSKPLVNGSGNHVDATPSAAETDQIPTGDPDTSDSARVPAPSDITGAPDTSNSAGASAPSDIAGAPSGAENAIAIDCAMATMESTGDPAAAVAAVDPDCDKEDADVLVCPTDDKTVREN